MSDGNKRYLGDVFLDEDNLDRQRAFFAEIIETYEFPKGNFNASMLGGKTPDQYATSEQGAKADKALLEPLFLGKTNIENSSNYQYLLTDAIKLDYEDETLNGISWYKNLTDDSLTAALINIYRQTQKIKSNLEDKKLDKTTYNDFIQNDYNELKSTVSDTFLTFVDESGRDITKLNAGLVNGLRFIPITQEAYDALPSSKKTYWRNIFIILDGDQIENIDPMQFDTFDQWQFRVNNNYLEFNNGISTNWDRVCSIPDLLSGINMDDTIARYLANTNNSFIVNETSLENSLLNMATPTTNLDNYPFISSDLKDDLISTVTINNKTNNVTYSSLSNGLKKVNLNIDNILATSITPQITAINSTIANEQSKLTTAQSNIASIQNSLSTINTKNTNQDNSINEINAKLTSIQTSLSSLTQTLNSQVNTIKEWKSYYFDYLVPPDGSSKNVNYYNKALGLAIVKFYFIHYHSNENTGRWVDLYESPGVKYNREKNGCLLKSVPEGSVHFTSSGAINGAVPSKLPTIRLDGSQANWVGGDGKWGHVYIKIDEPGNYYIDIGGQCVFRYRYNTTHTEIPNGLNLNENI